MRTIIYERGAGAELTSRQRQILNALQSGPLNRQQLMEKMHATIKDRAMQLVLSKLKNMRLIKSKGKAKSTIWSLAKKTIAQ